MLQIARSKQVVAEWGRSGLLGLWLALVSLGASCSLTTPSGQKRFAEVEIRGNTPGQIQAAAVEVFLRNGYQVARASSRQVVFEKPGSGWHNFAYGNWLDEPVWVRVKLDLTASGEAIWRVECHAYVLRDKGRATEEELPLSRMKSKPYQKMLEEVAARFAKAAG